MLPVKRSATSKRRMHILGRRWAGKSCKIMLIHAVCPNTAIMDLCSLPGYMVALAYGGNRVVFWQLA